MTTQGRPGYDFVTPSFGSGLTAPARRITLADCMNAIAPPALKPSRQTGFSIPTVDQIMVEERAAAFTKRSIKTSAKLAGLKMAVSMMDLTTLEGKDTPGKVAYLCRKALQPLEAKYGVPSCAAVCVYPNMVRYARRFLGDSSPVKVASVATGFPSGQMPLAHASSTKSAAPSPMARMKLTWSSTAAHSSRAITPGCSTKSPP